MASGRYLELLPSCSISASSSSLPPLSPPTPPRPVEATFHQLRVQLVDSRPSIWRCVCVPSYYSLFRLHFVLQTVFEWRDERLHCFRNTHTPYRKMKQLNRPQKGRRWRVASRLGTVATEDEEEADQLDEEAVTLSDALPHRGGVLWYEYDVEREGWDHRLVVEHVRPMGVSRCPHRPYLLNMSSTDNPPEGCGGIAGYVKVLERYAGQPLTPASFPNCRPHYVWHPWTSHHIDPLTVRAIHDHLTMNTEFIFQLHIALQDSKPLIWRRVCVPASYTLTQLHFILQALFEFKDQHVHLFRSDTRHTRLAFSTVGTLDPGDCYVGWENEEEVTLHEFAPCPGDSFLYLYSSTDQWRHLITVEKVLPRRNGPLSHRFYPYVSAGANCGPPEDCGGVGRYREMIQGGLCRMKGHEEWLTAAKEALGFELEERKFRKGEIQKRFKAREFQKRLMEERHVNRPDSAGGGHASTSSSGEEGDVEVM